MKSESEREDVKTLLGKQTNKQTLKYGKVVSPVSPFPSVLLLLLSLLLPSMFLSVFCCCCF